MILRGILDRSLGGSICIRGYAPMGNVSKASEPNKKYQRDIIPKHKKDIVSYLNKRDYLFFPEVVLSYTVNNDFDNVIIAKNYQHIIETQSRKNKKLRFSVSKKTFTGKESRTPEVIQTVTIDIDDAYLNEHKPFKRIDGNHRLTAVDELKGYEKDEPMPFCIVLLQSNKDDEKFESVIFHNINSKGKHLTSEENLKGILNEEYFTDEELKKTFSWSYVKARELINRIDFEYLKAIKNSFVNRNNDREIHKRTVAITLLEFLKENKLIRSNVGIDNLLEKLNNVNAIYASQPELQLSKDEGLLIAFIYYAFKQGEDVNTHLNAFKNWVLNNNIHELRDIDTNSIVKIYDKVLEQKLRVFMAMPYFSDTEVDNFNIILQRAINKIKEKNPHLNLSKYPVMREEGASIDIVSNLLNNIRNCEIFIADITDNNVNVFYEYGFAQSISKPTILVKDANDKTKVPFDVEHNLRLTYDGHLGLENLLTDRLEQTIIQLGFVVNN
ncbi:hypothetical protein ACJD0Z_08390 [Flavobacteriaceae bacterium M23B6Z8]